MSITNVISTAMEALAKLFSWREASIDNQAASEVINDKKDLQKACNYAELAVELVESRGFFMRNRDEKKFQIFVKKFRKYK